MDRAARIVPATEREWLVTNGLGSYASSTVAGLRSRRYHGLLVSAQRPPGQRTVLVSGVEETIVIDGNKHHLHAARWQGRDHPVEPSGTHLIERFRLDGSVPEWRYSVGDVRLLKRIWMEHGADTTYIQYTAERGVRPIRFDIDVFVEHRGFHETTSATELDPMVERIDHGVEITLFPGATPVRITCPDGRFETKAIWYYREFLAAEEDRGLDALTDRLLIASISFELGHGESRTIRFATSAGESDRDTLHRRRRRDQDLLAEHTEEPPWVQRLILAADQFIVSRAGPEGTGHSLIAGYPWFADWGRDTMIALPGLLLATGRPEIAERILRTYSLSVDGGMLPNRFPEESDEPEYNTIDATLWFFDALDRYRDATGDEGLIHDLYPVLTDVIDWHVRGTRHGIGVDPEDGLLRGGEPGTQLTWMDAKVGDHVITPRIGKPVEVNALWYHALRLMTSFTAVVGQNVQPFQRMADRVAVSFQRFWSDELDHCLDVIDGPHGEDAALRPNQLLAVSLRHSPLSPERQRAVVDACARQLLTPLGLRSLGPNEPGYAGRYRGGPSERDAAYHQGTAWAWLLGPFVSAHHRVYGDTTMALSHLDAIAHHLTDAGMGSISEIFDGDPPHLPVGAIAQAWSVAEVLRVWKELTDA